MITKWWNHEAHPDTVERLEAVTQRLEEVTNQFRDALQSVADPMTLGTPDVEDPARERGAG